jgi:hypothetical protein
MPPQAAKRTFNQRVEHASPLEKFLGALIHSKPE